MHAGDWKSEEVLDPLDLEFRVDVGAGTLQHTCIEVRRTYSHQFYIQPFTLSPGLRLRMTGLAANVLTY